MPPVFLARGGRSPAIFGKPWRTPSCRRGRRSDIPAHSICGGSSIALFALTLALPPAGARAAEVRITSRTTGEGYMVRIPGPEGNLLSRRRLVQYVGVGVYRILPPKRPHELDRDPEAGQLQVMTSMRIRHDFGTYQRNAEGDAGRLLRNVDGRQIDLLYGYLEGRNLGGWVDVRAGRQFEMSGLDFYSFDGGWIRARTPAHLAFEAFGGFAVHAGWLFADPNFGLDGTDDTPSDRAPTPMVGGAFALADVKFMDARFAYRRTWTPSSLAKDLTDPLGQRGLATGVDQEFISATVALRLAEGRVAPSVAARYHLGVSRLDDLSAAIQWAITPIHTLRAQYIRTIPVFDTDSIFNVFWTEPIDDVRAVFEVRPSPHWTLYSRFQGRVFHAQATADGSSPGRARSLGGGGAAGASWRHRRVGARADVFGLGGYGGMRVGGDLDVRTHVIYDRLALDGRAYWVAYRDDLVAARRGYSVALQAGANLRIAHGIYLNVIGEQLVTTFYRSAFRALATLGVDWAFRGGRP